MGLISQWKEAVGEAVREQRASREQSRSKDDSMPLQSKSVDRSLAGSAKHKDRPKKANQ
jgi:hypothetical protein